MILFCDTSALVKLYVEEVGSAEMLAAVARARMVAVVRIAWAEIMAALARRVRERPIDAAAIDTVRARLRDDWTNYAIVEVTQSLVELAGTFADAFALRGYDSVQLASARTVQQATRDELRFACFDARLTQAAMLLGIAPLRMRSSQ
ncbi:type II toxin-antitoxin system VapC family toxin [Tepidiphilus baoligensis]|uniref:PIN domain-containing protein n=1 Tax=Tepidiphilus baoligensis TaxID=2698687 RepID=A0ABX1QMK1_9PROT|nr:type II toxin-antitoxin system VapC family toxin [Tepidiphilus baoligensis]NMH16449.1 PIN domain-containing protein [Tepidiphilus baoligensis]